MNEESSEYKMDDWQAVQHAKHDFWAAFAIVGLGVFIGYGVALPAGEPLLGAASSIIMGIGALLLFAMANDGVARRVAIWLFRGLGADEYPWEAHDVEVTYRDE